MKIQFDRSIYSVEIIKRAIIDYSSISKIELTIDDTQTSCTFNECKFDKEITIREFANYLIDCINQENRYEAD